MKFAFSKNPVLIIDRLGLIGQPLSLKLSQEFPVVFVSQANLVFDSENQSRICLPFSKKFPTIPENKYSHIIFIDEERRDEELLSKIISKAKDVNADIIMALGMDSIEGYGIDKLMRMHPGLKIVILGDIFGKELIIRRERFKSAINKYIYQAQKFGKMQVPGEGMREAYPVFIEDVVDGLAALVSGEHKVGSLFYIFPKYPPSELSLAHMIQKVNPEITIDFVRHDPRLNSSPYPSNGKYLLSDNYSISQRIRWIDIKKKVKIQDAVYVSRSGEKREFPFFIVWILFFLFISPFIFTVVFSFLGFNTLYYAKKEIDRNNFSTAKSSVHLAQVFFNAGKQASGILSWQGDSLGLGNNLKKFSEDMSYGYKISESLNQVFNAGARFSRLLSGKSENPRDDLARGESDLSNAIINLNRIKAEGKISAQISQNLEIINPLIKIISSTADVIQNILGMEGQKTYLILLQNNMELRPGGGFIGSYGILTFDNGKITQFSMHDVYDADEGLRGHVEPPFAIRRYLQEKHWYMKDSNFSIDFPESAKAASNFLLIETGQRVSGVISIDVAFLKNILRVIGPVYVSEYGVSVDEDNLYALTQSFPEKNYFPGYTQNKDFLRSLSKAIMKKIDVEKTSYLLIAQAISGAISQKHLMFVFDGNLQNIFTANGWSSSLWDNRVAGEGQINDYVGISEADLGTNKVNYIISRQVLQKITIGDDWSVSEELTLNLKNEKVFLSGADYKNYLRVILPNDVILQEILIDDKSQVVIDAITDPLIYEAKDFKAPQGLEVEKKLEKGKQVFGFIINIPAGKTVKVKLKYMIAGISPSLNAFSYNLKLFKQPGVDDYSYSFSLNYSGLFKAIKGMGGVNLEDGRAWYSEKIIGDKNLVVDFAKK